jgi:tripartite-type tricarboxylate transporter receptor subunit TctC
VTIRAAIAIRASAKTDVSLVQVPYRGGGPALTDLIAGQVQVVFLPPAIARLKPTS